MQNQKNEVYLARTIGKLVLISCFAVVFNFFPEKIGSWQRINNTVTFSPSLSPAFYSLLPFLNLWWGLDFSLGIMRAVQKRWTFLTRLGDGFVKLYGTTVLFLIAFQKPFLGSAFTINGLAILMALLGVLSLFSAFTTINQLNPYKRIQNNKNSQLKPQI